MMLPLEDVRVLDLTTTYFGPLATQVLGDYGADVIKIESPVGDPIRHIGPARHPGMSGPFLVANRNKRSIALDLKRKQAQDALWRLIDSADMFVHNMRPAKIRALGFSPEAVLKRKPTMVYGGLHGYRSTGPYADRPAYDDVIQGESGVAALFAERDGEPALVPSSFVDKSAACIAASSLTAAYVKRLRTGEGVSLECSMFEAMTSYNLTEHQYGTVFDEPMGPPGYPRVLTPHRKPRRTRDGYLCLLPYTDAQWRSFWSAVGKPEIADDERFVTVEARSRNIGELYALADSFFEEKTTDEWLDILGRAQVAAGRVNSLDDLRQDPHLDAVGFFRPVEHPTEGLLHIPDTGVLMDGEVFPVRHPAPNSGEHGQALLEELGMAPDEIQAALGD